MEELLLETHIGAKENKSRMSSLGILIFTASILELFAGIISFFSEFYEENQAIVIFLFISSLIGIAVGCAYLQAMSKAESARFRIYTNHVECISNPAQSFSLEYQQLSGVERNLNTITFVTKLGSKSFVYIDGDVEKAYFLIQQRMQNVNQT